MIANTCSKWGILKNRNYRNLYGWGGEEAYQTVTIITLTRNKELAKKKGAPGMSGHILVGLTQVKSMGGEK